MSLKIWEVDGHTVVMRSVDENILHGQHWFLDGQYLEWTDSLTAVNWMCELTRLGTNKQYEQLLPPSGLVEPCRFRV